MIVGDSSRRRSIVLATLLLFGLSLLGIVILRRSPGNRPETQNRSLVPPRGAGGSASRHVLPSATRGPGASPLPKAELVGWARYRIHQESARWKFSWALSRYLWAPLPKEPKFWALVEELKRELGPEAAGVLSDLVDEAAAPRTKEMFTALMAGLKDPAAEARLATLASVSEEDVRTRGLALYGLGLLNTDSSWKAALASWQSGSPAGRSNFYSGLGLFGDRAAVFLLKEAETAGSEPSKSEALAEISGPGARDRLWEIAEASEDRALRFGAVRALVRDSSSEAVSRLFDFIEDPNRPADRRRDVGFALGELFQRGYALDAAPGLLDRVLSRWNDLPSGLQWSLLCNPAVRQAKPDAIDTLEPPQGRNDAYIQVMASDPARQAQLAVYAASHPQDDTLRSAFGALSNQSGPSDPALIALVRREALRISGEDDGQSAWAWSALRAATAEVRGEALRDAARLAGELSGESDRMRLVSRLFVAGPDAGPVAIDLLRKETSPMIRLELMTTALAIPGNEEQVQSLARAEIEQILSGVTDAGLRYAAGHPEGKDEGLDRYGELVRRVLGAYGTLEDIPKIPEYFSQLVIPPALRAGDKVSATGEYNRGNDYYRDRLQDDILDSIDAIRARN
jgi:hypothetical protein